jgi:hypothetical protein
MIVGIDFSINSTALTIKGEKSFLIFSFVPNYDSKLKGFKYHKELEDNKLVVIESYNKDKSSKDSVEDQRIKLKNADDLSNQILSVFDLTGIVPTEIRIEGFSYGSKGNSFIDLITYNTFLKVKLIQRFGHIIKVVPPKTLKKAYTGNGNASKCDMMRYFVNNTDSKLKKTIVEFGFMKEEGEFNIPKPFDDLIDSVALVSMEI